ncbi:MAG TPA: hypothetical protein VGD74_03715, partial [Vulgatibacter sp.]
MRACLPLASVLLACALATDAVAGTRVASGAEPALSSTLAGPGAGGASSSGAAPPASVPASAERGPDGAPPIDGSALEIPEPSSSIDARRPNRIRFGLGLPHVQIREELLRRFRWDGFGGLLALGYEHRTPAIRHEVGLEVPAAYVTNRYGAGAAAIALRLDYTLLVFAGDLWGGRAFVGGRYRWEHANQYYMDWDEEHLYWLNAHELGPVAAWEVELARSHTLRAALSVPVV